MSNKSEEELNAMAEEDFQITDKDRENPIEISDESSEEDTAGKTRNQVENANSEAKTRSTTKSILYDLIFYAVLIVVCVYVLPNYVIQRTIVDGPSMENTLHNGEQLYVEKISYHFDAVNRFDIIVFYPYGRENEDYYVKRVIGLPGETVQIIGTKIYINGEVLKEDYGKEPIDDPGRAEEPITLGDDEYFVLGDNRNISKDSRFEEVGNVAKKNIGGKVILRIAPLNKFGTVK